MEMNLDTNNRYCLQMSNQEKSKFMFEFRLLLENKIVEASR